jgi:hypothetical protein
MFEREKHEDEIFLILFQSEKFESEDGLKCAHISYQPHTNKNIGVGHRPPTCLKRLMVLADSGDIANTGGLDDRPGPGLHKNNSIWTYLEMGN